MPYLRDDVSYFVKLIHLSKLSTILVLVPTLATIVPNLHMLRLTWQWLITKKECFCYVSAGILACFYLGTSVFEMLWFLGHCYIWNQWQWQLKNLYCDGIITSRTLPQWSKTYGGTTLSLMWSSVLKAEFSLLIVWFCRPVVPTFWRFSVKCLSISILLYFFKECHLRISTHCSPSCIQEKLSSPMLMAIWPLFSALPKIFKSKVFCHLVFLCNYFYVFIYKFDCSGLASSAFPFTTTSEPSISSEGGGLSSENLNLGYSNRPSVSPTSKRIQQRPNLIEDSEGHVHQQQRIKAGSPHDSSPQPARPPVGLVGLDQQISFPQHHSMLLSSLMGNNTSR